jgi:hypothetical protein
MSYLIQLYDYLVTPYIILGLLALFFAVMIYLLKAGTFLAFLVLIIVVGIGAVYNVYPIWFLYIFILIFVAFIYGKYL